MGLGLLGLGIGDAATGVSTYVPATYGTVAAYWDFTNTAKVLKSGGSAAANNDAIDTLTDSGANSFNFQQTTNGNRPVLKTGVLNSTYQAALFTAASSNFMALQNPNPFRKNYAAISYVWIAKAVTLTAQECLFTSWDSGFNTGERCYFNWNGSAGVVTYEGRRVDADTNSLKASSGGAVATGNWYVIGYILNPNANTCNIYVNGSNVATQSSFYATTGNFENNNCPGGSLGALVAGSTWFLDGYIALGVVYSQALTSTDMTNIYNACHTQYGI